MKKIDEEKVLAFYVATVVVVGLTAIAIGIETTVVYYLWNFIAKAMHWPLIPSYWVAMAIIILLNLIGASLKELFQKKVSD